MGFEILSEPSFGPGGSFIPRADKTRFRSAFACVDGEKQLGWEDAQSMQQGRTSQDGKAKLVFEEFKDDKNRVNEVKYKGMRLREYFVPVDDALKMDKYAAEISTAECRKVTEPSHTPATANSIGQTRQMLQDSFIPPSAASFVPQ